MDGDLLIWGIRAAGLFHFVTVALAMCTPIPPGWDENLARLPELHRRFAIAQNMAVGAVMVVFGVARKLEAGHNQAAVREREEKLQAAEARLQQWQSQLEQGENVVAATPDASAGNDASVSAAWTKFYRSREILEEEQRQLSADRLALHEAALQLRQREVDLTEREARVSEAELQIKEIQKTLGKKASGLVGFTKAPFSFAKSVFTKT